MFKKITNQNNPVIWDALFSSKRSSSFETQPLLEYQEKAYKGQISHKQFEGWLNKEITIGHLKYDSKTQDIFRHAIYFTCRLMKHEYQMMRKLSAILENLEQVKSILALNEHSKETISTIKVIWPPLLMPVVDNLIKKDAYEFYILWVESKGKIPEENLKHYIKKARSNGQEELKFLVSCYQSQTLAKNCPSHVFAAWPKDPTPVIENLTDKLAIAFYNKWRKNEPLEEKLQIFVKLAQTTQNKELQDVISCYIDSALHKAILEIISRTREFFTDSNSIKTDKLLSKHKIKYNFPYAKLCKNLIPVAIPILAAAPILFSQVENMTKDSCHDLVYKCMSSGRDDYFILQNKKFIALHNILSSFGDKMESLNSDVLPYHMANGQLKTSITCGESQALEPLNEYCLHYTFAPLAEAHSDLIGARKLAWEFNDPVDAISNMLNSACDGLKLEIITEYMAERIGSSARLSYSQKIEKLFLIEKKILSQGPLFLKKLNDVKSYQNKYKEVLKGCPEYISIDSTKPFSPVFCALKTEIAKQVCLRFVDGISQVHLPALNLLLQAASNTLNNPELAWIVNFYLTLYDLERSIKNLYAFRTLYLFQCKNYSLEIKLTAKDLQPSQSIYHYMPFTTYSPLLFWHNDQLEKDPFVDFDEALKMEALPIQKSMALLLEAIRNPQLFFEQRSKSWNSFFNVIDEERKKQKEQLMPLINIHIEQLMPKFEEKNLKKEQKVDTQWLPLQMQDHMQEKTKNQSKPNPVKKKNKSPSSLTHLPTSVTSEIHFEPKEKIIQKNSAPLNLSKNEKIKTKPEFSIIETEKNSPQDKTIQIIKNASPHHVTAYVDRWMRLNFSESQEEFQNKYQNVCESNENQTQIQALRTWKKYFQSERERHTFPYLVDRLRNDPTYCVTKEIHIQNLLAPKHERHKFLFGWSENSKGRGEYVTFHYICKLSKGITDKPLVGKTFHRYCNNLCSQSGRFFIDESVQQMVLNCESKGLKAQFDPNSKLLCTQKEGKSSLKLYASGYILIEDGENNRRILLFPLDAIESESLDNII